MSNDAKELNDLLAKEEKGGLYLIGWLPDYYFSYQTRRKVDSQVVLGRVAAVLFAAGDPRVVVCLSDQRHVKSSGQSRIWARRDDHSGDLGVEHVLRLARKLKPDDGASRR